MSKSDKKESNNKNKNRRVLFIYIVLLISVLTVFGGILYINGASFYNSSNTENTQNKKPTLGSGGSVDLVKDYKEQAVNAWKSGDKKNAQELAKKGLKEYKNLTIDQSKQIPQSIEVSYSLQMMSEGRSPAE